MNHEIRFKCSAEEKQKFDDMRNKYFRGTILSAHHKKVYLMGFYQICLGIADAKNKQKIIEKVNNVR